MADGKPYFSFLICHHESVINAYYSGIPLGTAVWEDGPAPDLVFTPAVIGGQPVDLRHLPHPCPFDNEAELKAALHKIVDMIRFPEPLPVSTPPTNG
jgi:hypothetical protein